MVRRWLAANTVGIAFGAVFLATLAYWMLVVRDSWFWIDEWAMAQQIRDPGNILEPYNGHLSIVILGLYRILLDVVGFATYTPYRLAGVLSLGAVSLAMFLHARRLVGPAVAALLALVLLWLRGLSFEPGGLNHSLALAGGIVCAIGLTGRGRRRDLLVAASLVFALASAGGGVAVAAAAVVHTICTRGQWTRWVAVLLPSIAWAIWWRLEVPPDPLAVLEARPDLADLAWGALEHSAASFASIAVGNRVVGAVLLVAFIAHAIWRFRQGLAASANVLAWSAALYLWWFGLMRSRWLFLEGPATFRYELVSVAFIFLAVLPRSRPAWVGRVASDRRMTAISTAGVVLVAALLVVAVRPDLQRFVRFQSAVGGDNRARVALVAVKPEVVPDEQAQPLGVGALEAGQIRRLLRAHDRPAFLRDPDRLVLEAEETRLTARPAGGPPPGCTPLDSAQQVAADQPIVLHSGSGDPVVEVRRHGERWVSLGRLAAGRPTDVVLPSLAVPGDWSLRAEGACASTSVPS